MEAVLGCWPEVVVVTLNEQYLVDVIGFNRWSVRCLRASSPWRAKRSCLRAVRPNATVSGTADIYLVTLKTRGPERVQDAQQALEPAAVMVGAGGESMGFTMLRGRAVGPPAAALEEVVTASGSGGGSRDDDEGTLPLARTCRPAPPALQPGGDAATLDSASDKKRALGAPCWWGRQASVRCS